MIARTADQVQVSGDITMDTVSTLYLEGLLEHQGANVPGDIKVDFSGLGQVDSSAVSLMLTWKREAQKKRINLHFVNVPENLKSLAKLYGVADFIGFN